MITIRRADERGHFDHGWLNTYHTFSFADYYDPKHVLFRSLRVINEDYVAPGRGFGMHPHRDMEIITYVLDGEITHRDSMGNGSTIRRGDVQRMTAGTGVLHSEFNDSPEQELHLLQVWISPEKKGLEPGYEQRKFEDPEKADALRLIASRDGRDGSVMIHQDADVFSSVLAENSELKHTFLPGRSGWLQVASGTIEVNRKDFLKAGDGAAVTDETEIALRGVKGASEFLLFDLA